MALCHINKPHKALDLCDACYHRIRRQRNVERYLLQNRESGRRWRAANPAKNLSYQKRYLRSHPDKARIYNRVKKAKRRALKRGAGINDFTTAQWRSMVEAARGRCYYCGRVSEQLQQEHKIPLSRGGNHTASNIVPSCSWCNSRKGSRTFEEFCANLPLVANDHEQGVCL